MGKIGIQILNNKLLLEEQSSSFGVNLILSPDSYSYIITSDKDKLLAHNQVSPDSGSGEKFNLGFLIESLNRDKIVKLNNGKVNMFHCFPYYSLIPKNLFNSENLANYIDDQGTCSHFFSTIKTGKEEVVLAHGVPKKLINGISKKYPKLQPKHIGEFLIRQANTIKESNFVFCFIIKDIFYLVAYKDSRLVAFNHYKYTNSDDLLYFVSLIYDSLSFNRATTSLFLSGYIVEKSDINSILSRYYKKIVFYSGSRNTELSRLPDEMKTRLFNLVH